MSSDEVRLAIRCLATVCNGALLLSQRVVFGFEGPNSHKSKSLTVPG
jgi:hypothetical protein